MNRMYILTKQGGRGLLNIVECVENEDSLGRYLIASHKRLIKCMKDENLLSIPENRRKKARQKK